MDPVALVRPSFLLLLSYACYRDLRTRRVWAHLWWPHIAAGLLLAGPYALAIAGVYTAASYAAHRVGELGMADVKAVAAASLLFPGAATAAVTVAVVLAAAWALAVSERDGVAVAEVDVPFLVPLAAGLLAGHLYVAPDTARLLLF